MPPHLDSAPSVSPFSWEEIEVRPARTHAEYLACADLQKQTWGEEFGDLVPPSILMVAQRIGGLTAGAFDRDGRLLGFVFGITGVEGGRLVHWSDMLAVRPEARDLGLGRRLKEYQRDYLQGLGVEVVYWTYDPLVARNAHLNLNRLGVWMVEYVQDMYGDSASELHRGLGTDRFIVAWSIAREEESTTRRWTIDSSQLAESPVANPASGEPQLSQTIPPGEAPLVRVQIPRDIHQVKAASPEVAAGWRTSTRAAFLQYFKRGYQVVGFYCEDAAERCYYLLARPEGLA